MDLLFALYCAALFALPIILYKLSLPSGARGRERRTKDWHYALKRLLCYRKLEAFANRPVQLPADRPADVADELDEDLLTFHAIDLRRNSLYVRFAVGARTIEGATVRFAEISLQLRLADGRVFSLPEGPAVCVLKERAWRTQVLTIGRQPDGNFRLVFNGFLAVGDGRIEHVGFNCLFSRASDTLFYPRSFHRGSFGDAACRIRWKDGHWTDALGDQVGESHFGVLHGTVKSERFAVDATLSMAAYQSRRFGTADRHETARSIEMLTLVDDGTVAFVENRRTAYQPSARVRHGAVLLSNGNCAPVDACDLRLPDADGSASSSMTVHLSTATRRIKAFVAIDDGSEVRHDGRGYEIASKLARSPTSTGCGVSSILLSKRTGTADLSDALRPWVERTPVSFDGTDGDAPLTLPLDAPQARNVELTGGKGQSLSILSALSERYDFTVPAGFVITTRAMDAHTNRDGGARYRRAMYELKMACATGACVEDKCEALRDVILTTPMCAELRDSIRRALNDVRGATSFAVRSSGASEDSTATSAAGQNESFLGCRGDDAVLEAVVACWSSLYAFRSVAYRRNRGVDIETSMAVVLQAMVDARSAGVLFTCDLDGNRGRMRIAANYGLGESIASGAEGGDVVYVRRAWNDDVAVERMEVNEKRTKMLCKDGGGTHSVVLSDTSANASSLSEREALQLATIAVRLERVYEHCLDIEWAFDAGGRVALLQARPATFLDDWTEHELEHEFDAPCMSAHNVYTTANVKEVMPGAMTPLASSTIVRAVNASLARCIPGDGTRALVVTMRHHVFIDFYRVMLSTPSATLDATARSIDLSVCGHAVTTAAMLRRANAMHGWTTRWRLARAVWSLWRSCWRMGAMMEAARDAAARPFNANGASLPELIARIDRHLQGFARVIDAHSVASRASSFYQMFAMNVLTADGSGEPTPAKFAQIALLFSNGGGVVSAEIPALLEEIAEAIRRSERRDDFVACSPDRAGEIIAHIPEAREKYRRFLDEHGHRSSREFELMAKSWRHDKRALHETLQTLARLDNGTKKAPPMTVDDTVRQLESDVNARLLKFLIARCRSGVANREQSKSEVVRHVDTLREAFRHLGERLQHMHVLPQADLVYFLTYPEIKRLAAGTDPVLIHKATKRRRLYDVWNAYKFPEMSEGAPRPIAVRRKQEGPRASSSAELRGTPVCAGRVAARCCCVDDLKDVGRLRQGDVLIAHGTDVAWTPYFPMLAGVVTELGGLISHGAVVAREYGLPCLVGVTGALDAFDTGDRVVLDAANGRVYKVDAC